MLPPPLAPLCCPLAAPHAIPVLAPVLPLYCPCTAPVLPLCLTPCPQLYDTAEAMQLSEATTAEKARLVGSGNRGGGAGEGLTLCRERPQRCYGMNGLCSAMP